jgi:hypothetical protein
MECLSAITGIRKLFDNASSVGELLQTGAFKQQMARFLHKHKNDQAGLKA